MLHKENLHVKAITEDQCQWEVGSVGVYGLNDTGSYLAPATHAMVNSQVNRMYSQ